MHFLLTSLRMPAGSRYTLWYGSLALSGDPLRHLDVDLRRVASPGLHTAVCQEHVRQGVSGGNIVSINTRTSLSSGPWGTIRRSTDRRPRISSGAI
jgi:hypothetical protein